MYYNYNKCYKNDTVSAHKHPSITPSVYVIVVLEHLILGARAVYYMWEYYIKYTLYNAVGIVSFFINNSLFGTSSVHVTFTLLGEAVYMLRNGGSLVPALSLFHRCNSLNASAISPADKRTRTAKRYPVPKRAVLLQRSAPTFFV